MEQKSKINFSTTDELWEKVNAFKTKNHLENNNDAVEQLLQIGLENKLGEQTNPEYYLQDESHSLPSDAEAQIKGFIKSIPTLEIQKGKPLLVLFDKKTEAFYIECHILANELLKRIDLDAPVDPDNQEEYRANRELREENKFFKIMQEHAKKGRQFSDIVIEYSNEDDKMPLKVLGGQHRCKAIESSQQNRPHGVRAYFNLDLKKRVELYLASNSNIQIPPDLLDRLSETSLDPPNKLREWCVLVGLMKQGKDFEERRSGEADASPTVRMARTIIVNFYHGKNYRGDIDTDAPVPYLAPTGGEPDEEYLKLFNKVDFEKDEELVAAARIFVQLHKKQLDAVSKSEENAKKDAKMKAYSYSVLSAWSFAAGALQKHPDRLKKFYKLNELSGTTDPLSATAMQKARHPVIDKNTNYRGLGTRSDDRERGRVLALFLNYSSSEKPKITDLMCNAAIEIFEVNRAKKAADEAKKKAF